VNEKTVRLCGPHCPTPDEPHLDPEPDWIGDYPVMHGESERPVPGTGGWNGLYRELAEMYCLCGHPVDYTCPAWLNGGGLAGMTIERAEGDA